MRLCDTLFSVIRNLFRRFLLSKKSTNGLNDILLSNCLSQPVLFKNSANERNDILLSNCLCSLFYLKTVPVSAMKACFQIAECSLFYIKTVNAKPCFHVFRTVFPVVRRCHAKKRGDNLL